MNSFVIKLLHASESGGQLWSVFDDVEGTDCLQELALLSTEDGLLEQELTHPERNGSVQFSHIGGIVAKTKKEIQWAINQLIAKTEIADFTPLCENYFSSSTNPIQILEIPILVKIKADETQIPKANSTSWKFHLRVYGYLINERTLIVLGSCIKTTQSLQGCTRTTKIHEKMVQMGKALEGLENLENLLQTENEVRITP